MSDKQQVKRGKSQAKQVMDYRRTFEAGPGRAVLLDMMQEHGVTTSPFAKSKLDPLELAFHEGQRNVVLRILKFVNLDASQLLEAIEEQERQNAEE